MRQEVESESDLAILWYASKKTYRTIEDNRVGYQKLLVARSDKGSQEVYRGLQYVPEEQKLHRNTSRKVNAKYSTREVLELYNSRLYYKVAANTRI